MFLNVNKNIISDPKLDFKYVTWVTYIITLDNSTGIRSDL